MPLVTMPAPQWPLGANKECLFAWGPYWQGTEEEDQSLGAVWNADSVFLLAARAGQEQGRCAETLHGIFSEVASVRSSRVGHPAAAGGHAMSQLTS